MRVLAINVVGNDAVLDFAATEIQRYLHRISHLQCIIQNELQYSPDTPGIWLGLYEEFSAIMAAETADHPFDDGFSLRSWREDQLIAAGLNQRSVLFAVYAYLESLGCRWVRAGADGETLPQNVPVPLHGYDVTERPSYRYRGICIEGSLSLEHGLDTIAYMAKKRFNTYFIQFQDAYQFWTRWYDRNHDEPRLPVETAAAYTDQLIEEIQRRGLILQMVGHGWTNECLGVRGLGWIQTTEALPPEKQALLAEVNGVRDWWGGIPLNTELCLSNPAAFDTLVNYIVDYAAERPEIELLHVWMSDGQNNRCECAGCAVKRPSDWYVDVLNALDEQMTERGITTRIVFLVYVDLLWEPVESAIKSPDRFVLMFAPISRSYRSAMLDAPATDEQPVEFQLNHNQFPKSPAVNLQYLQDWRRVFSGDGFTYDYHLLWKHSMVEPTGLYIAEVLHKDVADTEHIGLQGMVNCQVQRYFFPTGLAMEVSGRTLWDKTLSFDAVKEEYFTAAFGAAGTEVQALLEELSAALDHPALFDPSLRPASAYQRQLALVAPMLQQARGLAEEQMSAWCETAPHLAASYRYLDLGLQFIEILLPGLQALAQDDTEGWQTACQAAGDFLVHHEAELHTVCDCTMWQQWLSQGRM